MSAQVKNEAVKNLDSDSSDSLDTTAEVLPFPEPIQIKSYPNTNLRDQYLKEKETIEKEYGTLEDMRQRLGLSRRKICQLLLVDPSAWTRWTKSKEGAPPHVYQSLKWYIKLNEQPSNSSEAYEQLKDAQQDQEHIPMVLEAKMLQISTVYERQLSKISQEIENLKSTLVAKEDISQSVRNTVSDTIAAQLAIHMARIQPQQQTPVVAQPQVVVQPDPRAEQLRYENAKYQSQVQSLEDNLRSMRHEMELLKNHTQKKSKKKTDDDFFSEEPSGAEVTNKFMASTLVLLALGGLLYLFIQYG